MKLQHKFFREEQRLTKNPDKKGSRSKTKMSWKGENYTNLNGNSVRIVSLIGVDWTLHNFMLSVCLVLDHCIDLCAPLAPTLSSPTLNIQQWLCDCKQEKDAQLARPNFKKGAEKSNQVSTKHSEMFSSCECIFFTSNCSKILGMHSIYKLA